MTAMIRARNLVKTYRKVRALDGLNLEAEQGTVLALLGPNGSGKTTTVRALTTLLVPDEGTVELAGTDVINHPKQARSKLGLSGQFAAVDEYLTGFENLIMIGRLYGLKRRQARARAGELLERFSLTEAAEKPSKEYSGGMRRRLDLAASLVIEPPVLVMDEPTTGLDPRSRIETWNVVRELVAGGTTLLLTTQYLEEADQLADKITVIDHGRVIAEGTANHLKSQIGGERIELTLAHAHDLPTAQKVLGTIAKEETHADEETHTVTALAPDGAESLMAALRELDAQNVALLDLGLRRPTLDDVFLALTGRASDSTSESIETTPKENTR